MLILPKMDGPQTVNVTLAHGDARETVEDKGSSPSSISAGSAEGGDANSSPPLASYMKSVELDPSAQWPECLVEHAGHDPTFLQELARNMESLFHTSKSRHMLGFDSVTNHGNLCTKDNVQILSCFPPKTLEKLDLKDWSDVTKEFVEEIFHECLEV
jgi:hypothetical protein